MTDVQRVNPVTDEAKESFESLRYYYTEVNKLYNPQRVGLKFVLPAVIALVIYLVITELKNNIAPDNHGLMALAFIVAMAAILVFGLKLGGAAFRLFGHKLLSKRLKEGTAENFKGRLVEVAEQQAGPFGSLDSAKVFVNGEYLTGGLASMKEMILPLKTITMVRFAGDSGTLVPTAPLHFLFGEKEVEMWRSEVPPVDEAEFDIAIAKAEKEVVEKPAEM